MVFVLASPPRDAVKKALLRDVLAKKGLYPSPFEDVFQSIFPSVHQFVRWVNRKDHATLIRILQRKPGFNRKGLNHERRAITPTILWRHPAREKVARQVQVQRARLESGPLRRPGNRCRVVDLARYLCFGPNPALWHHRVGKPNFPSLAEGDSLRQLFVIHKVSIFTGLDHSVIWDRFFEYERLIKREDDDTAVE